MRCEWGGKDDISKSKIIGKCIRRNPGIPMPRIRSTERQRDNAKKIQCRQSNRIKSPGVLFDVKVPFKLRGTLPGKTAQPGVF